MVQLLFKMRRSLILDPLAKKIEYFLYSLSPEQYDQQTLLANDTIYDANNDKYYFAPAAETDNVVDPFITSSSNIDSAGLVFGEAFENVEVEVWARFIDVNGDTQEEKRGQSLSDKLLTTGVPFFFDSNILQIQLRVNSVTCPLFSDSDWFTVLPPITPSGIGSMQIGFDNIVG